MTKKHCCIFVAAAAAIGTVVGMWAATMLIFFGTI